VDAPRPSWSCPNERSGAAAPAAQAPARAPCAGISAPHAGQPGSGCSHPGSHPRATSRILEETEVAIELEEVVATGTGPLRASAGATVALFGDASRLDTAFEAEAEPNATLAFFADSGDLGSGPPSLHNGEDSGAELDDLFADLVKD
jgi:hypothetical protein